MSLLKQMLGRLGKEKRKLSGLTSHSHILLPLQKGQICLGHALLEAATRGQALTSHQDHGTLRGSGVHGQEPQGSGEQPRKGPKKGAGSREELGLWSWTWVQILASLISLR